MKCFPRKITEFLEVHTGLLEMSHKSILEIELHKRCIQCHSVIEESRNVIEMHRCEQI